MDINKGVKQDEETKVMIWVVFVVLRLCQFINVGYNIQRKQASNTRQNQTQDFIIKEFQTYRAHFPTVTR